jgi:hypothetical protein
MNPLKNSCFTIHLSTPLLEVQVFEENIKFKQLADQNWLLFLNLEVTPERCQKLLDNNIFALQQDLLYPKPEKPFDPDKTIHLSLILGPDLWEYLKPFSGKTEDIPAFFSQLEEEEPDAPVFLDENWLALRLEQQQGKETVQYRTMWDFCEWKKAMPGVDIGGFLMDGFLSFASVSGIDKELSKTLADEMLKSEWFQALIGGEDNETNEEEIEEPHESTEESVDSLSNVFSKLIDDTLGNPASLFDSTPEPSPTSLFNQLIQFLVAEDWGFTRMPGEESLQIDFQGSSLRWICYARVLSENHYLLFYSYYPLPVEQKDYIRIHEFLALANLDMINGNFEFDTEEGHIRYKTSLWTDQKELSQEAFRQLIFSNVNIADDYFPALERMIKEGVGAKDVLKG